jgi:ATP-dependent helicase HrpB
MATESPSPASEPLPILQALPEIAAALAASPRVVLVAPPGAGKTTRVPTALMDAGFLGGRRIVMLAPRRVAARAAARHMAALLGEAPGGRVGYQVRFESRRTAATRIEVVTEGILTRRMLADAALDEIGLLIFDEFHERSLEADLGLALALDIQDTIRPDLRILVMSATLEAEDLSRLLGDAPIIRVQGRRHPVETVHTGRSLRKTVAEDVARHVEAALHRHPGSVLAFLPGEAEIRRAGERLAAGGLPRDVTVLPFHGSLGSEAQDAAIAPSPRGRRKVVLATTLAETSLTIEGIGIVVDGGFKRVPQFDPATGMSRLRTVKVSLAAAEQRRGRAGRLGPGVCYRLWPEEEERALPPHDAPEILHADLAPLALSMALWGAAEDSEFRFLDAPPTGALAQGRELLRALGALGTDGRITGHGRAMAALPLHPRLAHMVLKGKERGNGGTAAAIAALLSERDPADGRDDADLATRLTRLREGRGPGTRQAGAAAAQIRRIANIVADPTGDDEGALLALAYPDRIAQARDKAGRFRMANGGGAVLDAADRLSQSPFLAIATTDGDPTQARIRLAAPIDRETIRQLFADRIVEAEQLHWDKRSGSVVAVVRESLSGLVLSERPIARPDPDRVADAMVEGVRQLGLDALAWSEGARSLVQRVETLRRLAPQEDLPDLGEDHLGATLDGWLKPHLHGMTRREELQGVDTERALASLLTYRQRQRLDALMPLRFVTPAGSSIAIDYESEDGPALQVKLQEMFGVRQVPAIAEGRLKLKIVLMSPAGRPLAVTRDLESFWANAYPQVRAEMRGRYPKHAWPDDPLTAAPMRGRKPRSG